MYEYLNCVWLWWYIEKKWWQNRTSKNINALKTLLIEDVRIMISTGRLYKSIRSEIDNFIIPFNYLSCANGNVLFDEKFNILYKTIANSEILKILKPYYKNIFSLEMLDEYGMRTNKEPVEILIKIEEEKILEDNSRSTFIISKRRLLYRW